MTQALVRDDDAPHTRSRLAADLRRLGVTEGDTLLVHASLRHVGWIVGGAVAMVEALRDAVGPGGTLAVPTQTADNSDPSRWALTRKAPVPDRWWPTVREHLPPFRAEITPSRGMGVLAETVRCWPGAVRSGHPQTSFAALGPRAAELMHEHDVRCHLGPGTPLDRLREAGARVLLLGVSYDVCTAFHLAEYLLRDPPRRDYECVVADGADGRRWLRYEDVRLSDADFAELGTALEAADGGRRVRRGTVGAASCRLLPVRDAVTFAVTWMAENRP